MRYEEFDPIGTMKGWVRSGWSFEVDPAHYQFIHMAPPDAAISIVYICSIGMLVIVGPMLTASRRPVSGGDKFWGVRFEVDSFRPLFGIDPLPLVGKTLPLAQVLPQYASACLPALKCAESAAQCISAFEASLHPFIRVAQPQDPIVSRAAASLTLHHGSIRIEALAREMGLSARQLRRRFLAATGLPPKDHARIHRMRAALLQMVSGHDGLAGVAADTGFADQAHLTREVVSVFGGTPCSVAERLRRIEHIGVL